MTEIAQYGEAVLRSKATVITEFTPELGQLAARMSQIVEALQGLGLAAPQLRVPKQLIVARLNSERLLVLVNPRLELSPERELGYERCLSLPGELLLPVERALAVEVEAHDLDGQALRFTASGRAARVLQHEYDHLQGQLILDRTTRSERNQALRSLRQADLNDRL